MPPTDPRRLAGDDPAATLQDEVLERIAACRKAGVDPMTMAALRYNVATVSLPPSASATG